MAEMSGLSPFFRFHSGCLSPLIFTISNHFVQIELFVFQFVQIGVKNGWF